MGQEATSYLRVSRCLEAIPPRQYRGAIATSKRTFSRLLMAISPLSTHSILGVVPRVRFQESQQLLHEFTRRSTHTMRLRLRTEMP